ncbi:MAG: hypothetical protein QHH00_05975 [Methanomassiliicoccales archaeon]|nr:hypothetical protein [Methanomassiliicoccales archaeon]
MEIEEPGSYTEYIDLNDVRKKIDEVSQSRHKESHVLLIVSSSDLKEDAFSDESDYDDLDLDSFNYYDIKIHSISKRVQTQMIRENTIFNYPKNDNNWKGEFLWNLSLGIFSKLGGIPWKLKNLLSGVSAFIGLNTVSSSCSSVVERKGVVALEIINNWGEPITRLLNREARVEKEKEERAIAIDPSEVSSMFESALHTIEKSVGDFRYTKENDFVIVHVKDRYAKKVYEEIAETIASRGFKRFKIIHIQEYGGLRLYDPNEKPNYAWPQEGSYWYLEKGKIAFLYTIGTWRYSFQSGKKPYVIGARDLSPLQVNFVKGSEGSELTKDDLWHIYCLTRMHYYTIDLPRIKLPSTIRLGQRAAKLAARGLEKNDFDVSFLY